MNWKKIMYGVLWTISISGVIVSLAFVERQQDKVLCKAVSVNINQDEENYFIDKQDVLSIVYKDGDSLIGKNLNVINVKMLEQSIRENKYVETAEVYNDLVGNVNIQVKQRKPVLRIINSNFNSFYIDENGLKMPLSENYAARVLIANGNITESYGGIFDSVQTKLVNDIYELTKYTLKDEFWNSQIEQIYVEDNGDLVLIPRIGNHKIIFGDVSDMEEKFENLMVFYTKALPKVGWETYSTINVKFKGQIVGVRNDMVLPPLQPATDTTVIDSTIKL
jgi:cell division protein FtsQ